MILYYIYIMLHYTQTFTTPNYHPKSQPFIDHIFTFSFADNRIWFRNYQILEANGELAEIGFLKFNIYIFLIDLK